MNSARRDVLKFAGGAAVGAAVSPAPWRLLGDTAIWSQNWSWMPRVPRGEMSTREVTCTLCPGGCRLNARCAGDVPYAMAPGEHAICPAGVVGHHVAIHPLRLRETLHRGVKATRAEALEAAKSAAARGTVAVLDLLPGRVASRIHREQMAKLGGKYLQPVRAEGATAWAVSERAGAPGALRMELSSARTVLSVSTPVLDGWASPDLAARPAFHLIQADPRRSASARRANEWVQVKPGGELALLLALLAEVEGQSDALPRLAERAGVEAGMVRQVAERLKSAPALVVADGDPMGDPASAELLQAAAALQLHLSLDAYRRVEAEPAPDRWADVADRSIQLLLIDEPTPGLAMPWAQVEPKLAEGAQIVALTWNRQSFANKASWQVPVPVYLEGVQEAPPRHDAAGSGLRIAEGWLKPPDEAMPSADFVAELCGGVCGYEKLLKSVKPEQVPEPVGRISAQRATDAERREWNTAALRDATPLTVVAHGWRQAGVSPLLGKLWQESELMTAPNSAVANPETARQLGMAKVRESEEVQRGVLEICAGPAYVRDRGKAVRS